MHTEASSQEGWLSPTPPAPFLHRRDEARSRRVEKTEEVERIRYRFQVGISRAHEFPAGAEAERGLMRAVLVDASRCLVGEVSPSVDRKRLAGQARVWVGSRDERWLFSFENICASLDLEPGRLRALLLGPPEGLSAVCARLVARLGPSPRWL